MRRRFVFLMLIVSGLSGAGRLGHGCVLAGEVLRGESEVLGDSQLQMASIIRVSKAEHMEVQVELRNGSSQPFRFFGGNPVAHLEMALIKDGKRVPWVTMLSPPPESLQNVRTLEAGRSLDYRIALEDYGIGGRQGNLPPGRYELWAKYSIPDDSRLVKEFGLTPAKLDQLVALIELVDEQGATSSLGQGAVVGLGIVLLAGVAWLVRCPRKS